MGLVGWAGKRLFGGFIKARVRRNLKRAIQGGHKPTKAEAALLKEKDMGLLDIIPGRAVLAGKKTYIAGVIGILTGASVLFGFAPEQVAASVDTKMALEMLYGGILAMTLRAGMKNGK